MVIQITSDVISKKDGNCEVRVFIQRGHGSPELFKSCTVEASKAAMMKDLYLQDASHTYIADIMLQYLDDWYEICFFEEFEEQDDLLDFVDRVYRVCNYGEPYCSDLSERYRYCDKLIRSWCGLRSINYAMIKRKCYWKDKLELMNKAK